MKILVTGSKGQLGLSLKEKAIHYPTLRFIFTDVDELDITDQAALKDFFRQHPIDAVINCAGFTAVDKAETEKERAMLLNAVGVSNLAWYSAEFGFFIVQISTDYVFDGSKSGPYIETDKPNPLSAYGMTKYEGEKEFLKHTMNGVIIRTSWLYSEFGTNFVKTIRRLARERQELKVVNDQFGNPTYAGDLAEAIFNVIIQKQKIQGVEIYHFANEGITSWYEFAKAIVEFSMLDCRVKPISTSEYPLPAKRPAYSAMNTEKIRSSFNLSICSWKKSLKKCIQNIEAGL